MTPQSYIAEKVQELNENYFMVGKPFNFSDLEAFLTTSLKEAMLKGLDMAVGAVPGAWDINALDYERKDTFFHQTTEHNEVVRQTLTNLQALKDTVSGEEV